MMKKCESCGKIGDTKELGQEWLCLDCYLIKYKITQIFPLISIIILIAIFLIYI